MNLSIFVMLVLAQIVHSYGQSPDVPHDNPVRSAQEDLITNLPGLNYKPNFKQYSGYLNADDIKNRFWHYWFVESQSEPDKDPLVLWLNGGPGCSSLFGLLTELGPFRLHDDGQLYENQYAWNKHANIIFLESPVTVGFSYSNKQDFQEDDDSTATENHRALRSFMDKFPQFKGRPLYLTGESYGGVYLPTLGSLVDDDPDLNLKGIAIGNGFLNANTLLEGLIFFNYYHGLFGKTTWDDLAVHCCNGNAPSRTNCEFLDEPSSECTYYVQQATEMVINSGINPYNILAPCSRSSLSEHGPNINRQTLDKSLVFSALYRDSSTSKLLNSSLKGDAPCSDDQQQVNWLNSPEVKRALHIPNGVQEFTPCSDLLAYTMLYPLTREGLAPQVKKLLNSERKLHLIVYNGDVDCMCNTIGDEWFVDDLGLELKRKLVPWHLNGQVSGYVKHYEGLTFLTVKGSGHMVPADQPEAALMMFETFIRGHNMSNLDFLFLE